MELEIKIAFYLIEDGIPAHLQGFKYLIDCIEMVLEANPMEYISATNIYLDVARKHKTTWKTVERAVRFAISKRTEKLTNWAYIQKSAWELRKRGLQK